jgi:hypothetical protein
MEIFSPLSGELTAASHTSNNGNVIGELCLKPPVNVIRVLPKAKPNDHSLLALHPAAKIYTSRDIHILRIAALSRGGPHAQPWCSEGTQYWLFGNA